MLFSQVNDKKYFRDRKQDEEEILVLIVLIASYSTLKTILGAIRKKRYPEHYVLGYTGHIKALPILCSLYLHLDFHHVTCNYFHCIYCKFFMN